MKYLALLSPLFLTACLGASGGSSPAQKIVDPAPISGVTEPTGPTPSPTPSPGPFSMSTISGKTLSQASGSISFTNTVVNDARCGITGTVTEVSEASEAIVISISVDDPTLVNFDCAVQMTDETRYVVMELAGICQMIDLGPIQAPFTISYLVARSSSGAILVSRLLRTINRFSGCHFASLIDVTASSSMAQETYFE
jgi:hypothetical protein